MKFSLVRYLAAAVVAALAAGLLWWVVSPEDALALSPARIEFPETVIGRQVQETVVITNRGDTPIRVEPRDAAGPFSIAGTVELAPGASAALPVQFKPEAAGAAEGTLELVSQRGTVKLAVRGSAKGPPSLVYAPDHIAFGPVVAGREVRAQVQLENHGEGELRLETIRTTGPFRVLGNLDRIPGGESAQLELAFTAPPLARHFNGRLTLETNDTSRPHAVIALEGSALEEGSPLAPRLVFEPGSLDFGAVPVGGERLGWLSLRNEGDAPLALSTFTTRAPFSVPLRSREIAPGASLPFPVTFRPGAHGEGSGSLVIHHNDPNAEPLVVSLRGEGADASDPRVIAALEAPDSRRLTPVGAVPEQRFAFGLGTETGGADATLEPGPGDTPDEPAAPAGPRVIESELRLESGTLPLEAGDFGEFVFDPDTGTVRLTDVQIPSLGVAVAGFVDFEPTSAAGLVNELGDIELELPLMITDRNGITNEFTLTLTTGTSVALFHQYPQSMTGTPVGSDGTFKLVGILDLPRDGAFPRAMMRMELNGSLF